jgi:hypothetical protein
MSDIGSHRQTSKNLQFLASEIRYGRQFIFLLSIRCLQPNHHVTNQIWISVVPHILNHVELGIQFRFMVEVNNIDRCILIILGAGKFI